MANEANILVRPKPAKAARLAITLSVEFKRDGHKTGKHQKPNAGKKYNCNAMKIALPLLLLASFVTVSEILPPRSAN